MLTRYLDEMRQDSRHAARMMIQHPSFTAAAVLSLALGIGANTAIFSVINALILNPPHIAQAERVAAIWTRSCARPSMRSRRATRPRA